MVRYFTTGDDPKFKSPSRKTKTEEIILIEDVVLSVKFSTWKI